MKKITKLLSMAFILCISQTAVSKPSINTMQTCQGLLDYLEIKLQDAPSNYPIDKVKKVREGLSQYHGYIQEEIVTPGLLQFNGGDASKAEAMQQQVDAYKTTIVKGLTTRYSSYDGLVTDHAISVNECAKEAVPSGEALENLKYAINTLIELAQIN